MNGGSAKSAGNPLDFSTFVLVPWYSSHLPMAVPIMNHSFPEERRFPVSSKSGLLVCFLAFALIVVLSACSGDSSKTATVHTSMSDPSTCKAPQGPYNHIYVTVTDVLIHTSANASANDNGWVDLTPDLQKNPVQVDLLGVSNQCFLATLGSAGIPAGSYQQIRIILAPNSSGVNNNKCDTTANCLMLASDLTNTPLPLQLSSQTQTGIKIPSGQIAGGKFVVAGGDNKDLNIDFDACASIVSLSNGQFRLKPVLHVGEVALQSASTSISGTVIDIATQQAILGGNTVVALEQQDTAGVDRVIMQTLPDSNGGFSFCPLPAGSYDVVISAVNGAGVAYAATVITGVQPGSTLGTIPLTPAALPASINGTMTSSGGGTGVAVDITLSALESITVNNITFLVIVPLAVQSAATASLGTATGAGCPPGTACASYTLLVPASTPSVGAFNSGGNQTPAAPVVGPSNYTIDAQSFLVGAAPQTNCSPSDLQTNQTSGSAPLLATSGLNMTGASLSFTDCN